MSWAYNNSTTPILHKYRNGDLVKRFALWYVNFVKFTFSILFGRTVLGHFSLKLLLGMGIFMKAERGEYAN